MTLIGPPPGWPAEIGAAFSTRADGISPAPWATLNLGDHVGDDPARVVENRRRWAAAIGVVPVYLRQVHGTRVARLTAAGTHPHPHPHTHTHTQTATDTDTDTDTTTATATATATDTDGDMDTARAGVPAGPIEADAAVTTERGIACTVLVADCLPVLFAAPGGVGAAHAGWRGLAGGVLEATVAALCEAAGSSPSSLHAWLGPCIGPAAFEVGADVLAAFDGTAPGQRFRARHGQPGKWYADLAGLARDRLRAAGVGRVDGLDACTVAEAGRFFSYRRDGVTGRMAASVWRR